MVCSKCQKLQKTTLATPGVKRKNEIYYGSPTTIGNDKSKSSAAQGPTGIGKVSGHGRLPSESKLTKHYHVEQTLGQKREKPLRCLLKLLHHMQNQDGGGKKVLSALRL